MGPSMSHPQTFKQKNRQKHMQAYNRKFRTEISLDSKIKLIGISQLAIGKNRQPPEIKIQMKREYKQSQRQQHLLNPRRKNVQNEQDQKEQRETPFKKGVIQQANLTQISKQKQKLDTVYLKNLPVRHSQVSIANQVSHNNSLRKIVLNNKSYEIDVEKMKNRRLRSKERYMNSILSNAKNKNNQSKTNGFNTKPSINTNSAGYGVSTLELQSQLHSIHQQTKEETQQNILQNISGAHYERVPKNHTIISHRYQQQKVRIEYYNELKGSNFQSKQSREYQQKLKHSRSQSDSVKHHHYTIKTEKILPMNIDQQNEYYNIQSQKQIKPNKSSKLRLEKPSAVWYGSLDNAQDVSQTEITKAHKIIKVQRKQQLYS